MVEPHPTPLLPGEGTQTTLNAEQQAAVTHDAGALLIVAGAGTGKTTVITQRILWLIESKRAKPEEILALTFTDKAAGEMVERVDRILPYGYTDLRISTFHAFCERVLRDHGLDIGIPNEFRLLDGVAAWVLVRKNLEKFTLDYYRPLGNPAKFIRALTEHFSRCKDEAVTPEEYLEYAKGLLLDRDEESGEAVKRYSSKGVENASSPLPLDTSTALEPDRLLEVANAYHTYEQLLLDNAALDFGGLLLYTLKLFRERPAVLAEYRKRFRYVLVDEFQDTNFAQYEIVKLLAAPANNLTVVGDDDQALYSWRGASMSNILHFKDDYPNARNVVLTENYRSRQNILDRAYAFIQKNNPNRLEVRLSTGTTPLVKRLSTQRQGEGTIEHLHGKTASEEARLVAEKILALRLANPTLPWSEIAILVRANHGAEPFLRALERHGIPYEFLAAKGLYAMPVILDLLAYLRLCDDYHESTAFYRVLTSPVIAMDERDVVVLMHEAGKRNRSLFALAELAPTLSISAAAKEKLVTLLSWIRAHTQLARKKTVGEVLFAFLEDSGYLKELTRTLQQPRAASQKSYTAVRAVERFFKEIAAFEDSEAEPTVQRFLEAFAIRAEGGDAGSMPTDETGGPDTVKVMTIHGAKGLEFRFVFIAQLVELRFPSVDRKDPIELPAALVREITTDGNAHLEEERRLFYVAMTRAKDGLFFTSAEDYGGQRTKRPSVFLYEVGMLEKPAKPEARSQKPAAALTLPYGKQHERGEEPTARLRAPSHFSYSQLAAFEACPLQYKFAHILKIPVRGRFTFSFGKSIHLALQKFFEARMEGQGKEQQGLFESESRKSKVESPAPTLDDLLTIYKSSWLDEWYESKKHEEEYFEKGKRMLTEFYRLHEGQWPTTAALEHPFTMKVGEYTIKGVIDRIDRVPGGVALVDYKTGKTPEKERDVPKEQLLLYQIAVKETMGETAQSLVYYYLDAQKQFSFVGTDKELAALQEKMIATMQSIEQSDFAPTPSSNICNNCDFRDICEYRQ